MPSLNNVIENHGISGSSFQYSAVGVDNLEELAYTLSALFVDRSGSMSGRETLVEEACKRIISTCKSSPKVESIMTMLGVFDDEIDEIFGFRPLDSIADADIAIPYARGATALIDGSFFAVGAIDDYAKKLNAKDIDSNGILWVVTDGYENASRMNANDLKEKFLEARRNENLESLQAVLISIGADCHANKDHLEKFALDMGFDHYFDLGDFDEATISKLTGLVSESLSSTSQNLGTGGPSQIINPNTGTPAQSNVVAPTSENLTF